MWSLIFVFHHLKYQTKDQKMKFDTGTNEIRQEDTKFDGNTPNE